MARFLRERKTAMVVDLSVWGHSHVTSSPFRGTIRATVGAIILVAIFLLGVGEAQAQTADSVCSNTPSTGERIECEENAASTDNIDIDTSNITISTTAINEDGIEAFHYGSGDIVVNSQSDTITTTGNNAFGINVDHLGATGDVTVSVTSPTIMTGPLVPVGTPTSHGIRAGSASIGKLDVDIQGGSITTNGDRSTGVLVWHAYQGTGDAGPTTLDINGNAEITTLGDGSDGVLIFRRGGGDGTNILNLEDVTIGTMGSDSSGVWAEDDGFLKADFTRKNIVGDVEVNMLGGVSITTEGEEAHGVTVWHKGRNTTVQSNVVVTALGQNTVTTSGKGAYGLHGTRRNGGAGKVRMDLQDIAITTKGTGAFGIFGDHHGIGDIDIALQDATIVTESTANNARAIGIYALHRNLGNVDIDLQGGSIETKGVNSYGVYGVFWEKANGGKLEITTGRGHTITTTGMNGHGIYAEHEGEMITASTSINVGGNITTTGAGAQGVRVGRLSSGAPARVAPIHIDDGMDEGFVDGHRRQTVTVNGSVMSAAEGVFLAGGGRVVIGRRGSIASDSGIAILATGVVPEDTTDPNNVILAIQPKLRVDLNLRGRRVAQAIGENWIINDGGETTIAVNGVVLHDGETGVTGRRASNGAWNVMMREEGVTVTDYTTDPWVITEPATGVIADRDFSVQDFNEHRKPPPPPPPPPPPSCPDGQVGTPPELYATSAAELS